MNRTQHEPTTRIPACLRWIVQDSRERESGRSAPGGVRRTYIPQFVLSPENAHTYERRVLVSG
ncbi:MAG: hypothetical protein JXA28_14180 [Bacteroidetes bacterium]|nr:hypothetical protein [Bacteroidota bacterium]